MQKQNPVIKNYILSSEKCILKEDAFSKNITETLKYRALLEQSMACFYPFPSRKEQKYH